MRTIGLESFRASQCESLLTDAIDIKRIKSLTGSGGSML